MSSVAFVNPFHQLTSAQKWQASILFALLFFILSSNVAYGLTNNILGGYLCTYSPVGASFIGLLLHTVIFLLIVRWIMN